MTNIRQYIAMAGAELLEVVVNDITLLSFVPVIQRVSDAGAAGRGVHATSDSYLCYRITDQRVLSHWHASSSRICPSQSLLALHYTSIGTETTLRNSFPKARRSLVN